jgi:hypothetical protein
MSDSSASDRTVSTPSSTAGEREYDICKKCGVYGRVVTHGCPPEWEVRREDEGWDDWNPVHGLSEEDAAVEWCDRHDCENEYSILQNGEAVLFVRRLGDTGNGVKVEISAESRAHYTAYAQDEAPAVTPQDQTGGIVADETKGAS